MRVNLVRASKLYCLVSVCLQCIMHLIEEHYYTINKTFLKILGIWPCKSRFAILQRLFITVLTITYIGMQLSVFITMKYNVTLFIKIMSHVLLFIIVTTKYFGFILKSESVQNLHYLIREDWSIIQNKLESKIIMKHAHYSQICTIILFLLSNCLIIAITTIQFLPNILDLVSPLEEPRPRKLIIMAEYFIFQDKYFFTKVLHEIALIVLSTLIIFATASQLLVFSWHSFGMFKIASHRIEFSIEDNILHIPNSKKEYVLYKRIMHAVIAHRRAMEFSNVFISAFNAQIFVLVIVGVLSLSINLYGFVEAAMISKNIENLTMCFFATVSHLVYIFIANYVGQKITDSNNGLFKLTYGTSWYLMPVSSQKLILFLMQKTGKDFYLTVGFIFMAKLETFATFVNAALSYVAVMYSRVH